MAAQARRQDCSIRAMKTRSFCLRAWDVMHMWRAEAAQSPAAHQTAQTSGDTVEVRSRLLVCVTEAQHGNLSPAALWSSWL